MTRDRPGRPRWAGSICSWALLLAALSMMGCAGPNRVLGPGGSSAGGAWQRPGSPINPGGTIPAWADEAIVPPAPEIRPDYWIVHTRHVPQVMGTDPWPMLAALQFDEAGALVGRDPADLLALAAARPVLIVLQGNHANPAVAANGGAWIFEHLRRPGALPPDALVVSFDWPSQRVFPDDFRDGTEKMRRGYVAGYHLARFLQEFPPGARLTLLGHSLGGRAVLGALHLLGGGVLDSQSQDPPTILPGPRPDLRLRAVTMAGSHDHHWLNPGERFDRALHGAEAILNLHNRRDGPMLFYPLAPRSGNRPSLGRRGLTPRDRRRLGPLLARYEEIDMGPILGREHTLLGAVTHPAIAAWIAPYAWALGD